MNSVPNNPANRGESSGFVFREQMVRKRRFSFFPEVSVEVAAAGTSVTVYHPLRTIATQLSAGYAVQLKFGALYRGFWASACGAHQLFLMAAFERHLTQFLFRNNEEPTVYQRMLIGATAGVLTTPTVTPFDMAAVQKQLKRTFVPKDFTQLFRGIVPLAFRQAGLGAGMFILPQLMAEKLHAMSPSTAENHPKIVKLSTGFAAGCVTVTATQLFEFARLMMQEDVRKEKYPTTLSAFKAMPNQFFSVRGLKMYGVRLSVVAAATMAMNASREFFTNCFKGKD